MRKRATISDVFKRLAGFVVFVTSRSLCQAAAITETKLQPAGINNGLELKGAFYCCLDSGESWEQFAKVGSHADVKVRFGNPANSLILWRASSYLPHWQTASGGHLSH